MAWLIMGVIGLIMIAFGISQGMAIFGMSKMRYKAPIVPKVPPLPPLPSLSIKCPHCKKEI